MAHEIGVGVKNLQRGRSPQEFCMDHSLHSLKKKEMHVGGSSEVCRLGLRNLMGWDSSSPSGEHVGSKQLETIALQFQAPSS